MRNEAAITVNGTRLTDTESMVLRRALATFEDILANQMGFKDDGIALTDQYLTDVAHVRALIEGSANRIQ
jgi:hypothetical protein